MFGPLTSYLRPYKWRIFWASFCSIANQVFDISQDVLMGLMVDVALRSNNSFAAWFGFETTTAQLLFFVGITVLNGSVEALFEYLYTDAWGRIAHDLQHDVRVQLYRHLQKLPLSYFESNSIGSLTTVVNDDVSRLEQFLDGGNYQSFSAILQMVSSTITVGFVLFMVSPLIMCIAFVPVLIVIALSYYFKYRLGRLYKKVRKEAGKIAGIVAHNIRGIATIKSFVTQLYEQRRVEKASAAYRDVGTQAVHTSALFVSGVRLAVASGYVASVATGAFFLMNDVFTTGAFTTLIFEAQRLIWPFIGLRDIIDGYERVMAAASRIDGVLKTPIETLYRSIIVPSEEVPDPLDIGDISFSHVSFSYKSSRPVLRDLSLVIPENKTVAFVGTTGCGKSTVVKLLLRLYNPQEGTIYVGNRALHEVDAYALRRSIGLVSQEVFMIAGTIRENICYGIQKVSDETVIEAAKAAEIHDFIMQLPEAYDTVMEERGQIFSGGQCQRIAIARALVREPQLLILDEATSAVDNETEEAINNSLAKMRHERTIVIIAHRLSAVRNADIIYVLDKGIIIEQGVHAELIALGGLYNRLWKIQSGSVSQ
ncbi:MAG: ATP-binding cassette, subfamily bacterial [Candidatus Dependentiae bacterium]|nr:ATP-binding cassette, subfamily bacterial [Candidatus Dependentiae bacterium]